MSTNKLRNWNITGCWIARLILSTFTVNMTAAKINFSQTMTCDEIVTKAIGSSNNCKLAVEEGFLKITPQGTLPVSESPDNNEIYWIEYWDNTQDPAKTMPFLVVNGGPGGSFDYMLPLRYLACRASRNGTPYRLIFYDQLGSGRSEKRNSTGQSQANEKPSVNYLTTELQAVVQGVVLRQNSGPFHLLGQGFGGLIALSYATTYSVFTQQKMASLILSSPAAPDVKNIAEGVLNNMKQAFLTSSYYDVLLNGNTADPSWNDALAEYNDLLILRQVAVPDCVDATLLNSNDEIRETLWGAYTWQLTGTAAFIDLRLRLPQIMVPVFAFIGQYDAYPQSSIFDLSEGITHIPWIHTDIIPGAGHLTWLDNFEYVYNGLNQWLDDTDSLPYFEVLSGTNFSMNSLAEVTSERNISMSSLAEDMDLDIIQNSLEHTNSGPTQWNHLPVLGSIALLLILLAGIIFRRKKFNQSRREPQHVYNDL